ncbi:MAG: hypothetical protein NZ602_12315 [Thermoguttaceae bacterium]|nr:hypothetical protein [Thermoguttaceae bacterium]MDW8037068.1 hypothetical protein [Thermoguttaceae bacterium]
MYVPCPHCRGWMVGDGIPVGAAVVCPHCQKQFVMSQQILAAGVQTPGLQSEAAPPTGSGTSARPPGGWPSADPASAAGLTEGLLHGAQQPPLSGAPPRGGRVSEGIEPSASGAFVAGVNVGSVPVSGGITAGASSVPMGQMPGMTTPPMAGIYPPSGGHVGMPAPPVSMPIPSMQTPAYSQPTAAPARQPSRPQPRPVLLSTEALLVMGFSLMIVAVLIVALLGYGGRPSMEKIGKPSEKAALAPAKGPLIEVQYDLRRRIIYIENKDRSWQEAELRINPDPADDEGGYRCQLGEVPRGRKKPVLLDQCLSPSGARFQGDIQRIVVIAKTADGTLRYVSDIGSSPK